VRSVRPSAPFRKDFKRLLRSGRRDAGLLKAVVADLAHDRPLAPRLRDHALKGEWSDCRECHIQPDWLLIYRLEPGLLILVRTGSHAELFRN
jgi:mRNA interferase YafQ